MNSILTLNKFAFSTPLLGLTKWLFSFPASAKPNSDASGHDDRSWHDDYLIGKSDMDAAWYYERRRWRT